MWRIMEPTTPIVETMSVAAVLNLIANGICLRLLTPYRHGDVDLASAWECSRNDVYEDFAVLVLDAVLRFSRTVLVFASVALLLSLVPAAPGQRVHATARRGHAVPRFKLAFRATVAASLSPIAKQARAPPPCRRGVSPSFRKGLVN